MVQDSEYKLNGSCQRSLNDEEALILHGPEQQVIEGLRGLGEEVYDRMLVHGDKVCMIDGDTDLSESFTSLRKRGAAIALALKARGVKSEDVITLVELTCRDAFAVVLGVIFSGGTLGMLDGAWTVPNTAYTLLPLYKSKVVFTHVQCLNKVRKVLKTYPEILEGTELIVYGYENEDECEGCTTIDQFIADYDDNDIETYRPTKVDDLVNTPLLILCTSGSTGVPKGVVHNNKSIGDIIVTGGTLFPSALTLFTNAPCYWTSGIYMFLIALYSGCKKVYTKKPFSELNVLGLIQKYQVSAAFLSCYQISLVNQHEKTDSYDLSSLRILLCGGSRLSEEQIAKMQARIPKGIVSIGYGMTELCAGTGLNPGVKSKPGSVGKLGAGLSLKVVDIESGKLLGPEQSGEIYLKGPAMMGYYSNKAATDEILDSTTNWLRTGDIGYYDAEGYVFITDRLKEIAKYKGLYINPSDIEAVLIEHKAVKAACVITVPHDDTCDLVVAFVEIKPGHQIQDVELEQFVNDKVEDYQRLRGGLYFVETLPILTHGKIARPAVKQIAASMKQQIVDHFKKNYGK
uniref:Putative acyl-coa synthetase n=1 Tax=Xenopsylla cheopis TaxID=163159 RepID=A0A6M2DSP1_XENCH